MTGPATKRQGERAILDPLVHAQPRLQLLITLAALGPDDRVTFPRLRELLDMTAGNLSTHLRRLDEAGYVAIDKAFRARVPVTYVALTTLGRRALTEYTNALQDMLRVAPIPDPLEDSDDRSRAQD